MYKQEYMFHEENIDEYNNKKKDIENKILTKINSLV